MRVVHIALGIGLASCVGAGLLGAGCGGGEDNTPGSGGATTTSSHTGATGGSGALGGGGHGNTGGLGGQGGEPCVPGSDELCDGIDNNCDNIVDESCPCIEGQTQDCYDGDPGLVGVGECAQGTATCDIHGVWGACQGQVLPNDELCDGKDNDCNHAIDDGLGTVTCGLGICQNTVEACANGQPVPCIPGQANPSETCDGSDDNCNGTVDEGCTCINNTTQPCYSGAPNTRGVGECKDGTQTCAGGVWGACSGDVTPSLETCDTKDNDCNGTSDDGDPGGGGACDTGVPGYCSFGVLHCQSGQVVCVQTHQPISETCNGVDDNCDNTVDDGNPGGGAVCNTGGFGVCAVGTRTCLGGSLQCVQNSQPSSETCDGLDNNCNGTVDENNPGGGAACTTGLQGVCSAGTRQCQAGQLNCVQTTQASPETCDNLDNNCDGTVDNGDPGGGAGCTTGLPGVCSPGVRHCIGGSLQCQQTTQPSPETCDNLDNNCAGGVDEGNPGGGAACVTGLPGQCSAGTRTCQGGSLQCVQNSQSSAETCDNIDNDCNGIVDNGDPGGGGACTTGYQGVCSAGTRHCSGGSLQCQQNVASSPEVCDNLDNNCDGAVDNGDPGGGVACTTGLPGVCSPGTRHCIGGSLQCQQNVSSGAEVCGDGLDNDCNGTVDNGCCSTNVIDGGFEVGPPWPAWTQASTCCGTPLCDIAGCCSGQIWCYAHAGTYWSWFGGVSGASESSSVQQSVVIPVGATTLTFYFMIPACASQGTDFMRILIDGSQVFNATRTDPLCDGTTWVQKSVNISSYANGASHVVRFESVTQGLGATNDKVTNFMVDDVSINYCIP